MVLQLAVYSELKIYAKNILIIFLVSKRIFTFSCSSNNKIVITLTYGKMTSGRTQ